MKPPKYSIKLNHGTSYSYLSVGDRSEWCRSQAYKHLKDLKSMPQWKGVTAELEPN